LKKNQQPEWRGKSAAEKRGREEKNNLPVSRSRKYGCSGGAWKDMNLS
jgi:hypothetical protein